MSDLIIGKDLHGKQFKLPSNVLKKHLIALGNSGSGKTVLCKTIIEEASIKGIPCILVDPQGDLASLIKPLSSEEAKKHKIDMKKVNSYKNKTRITIFTPTSSKGIPISINPLKLPTKKIDKEDLVGIINQISSSICNVIGYKQDKAKAAESLLYLLLMHCYKNKIQLNTFNKLIDMIINMPVSLKKDAKQLMPDTNELVRKLKFLTIGEKELLFQFGVPLDIEMLLGKGVKKTQVSIIYLNSLNNLKDKQFFLSTLSTELYKHMLMHPSKSLQALFYIDEISPYLPAGALKPVTKPILKLLYKQARKYGIGCIVATQNPGDIDYTAFAQFGTWCIGRLTTKQDKAKIKGALESLAANQLNSILTKMSKLKPGEFIVFSPDIFKKIQDIKVRWLLTDHSTLNDVEVKTLTTDELRKEYDKFMVKKIEQDMENVEEEVKDVNVKKGEDLHLPLVITKEKISKMVEKSKKKKFILFGKKTENVEKFKLELYPLFLVTVRKHESKFLGLKKEVNEYKIFFDGFDGELVRFKSNKIKSYKETIDIMKLTETEQLIFIQLLNNKKMTSQEVGMKLGLSDAFVNKTLHDMTKKKAVTYEKIPKTKAFAWKTLIDVDFSSKLKKLVYIPELVDDEINAKKLSPKVDLGLLGRFVRIWFKGEIVEAEIVYIPVYSITLVSKNKKRQLRIDGVSGKEFKVYD